MDTLKQTHVSEYKLIGVRRSVCFNTSNGDDDVTLEGISSPDDRIIAWSTAG